jgi:hypothetical protein
MNTFNNLLEEIEIFEKNKRNIKRFRSKKKNPLKDICKICKINPRYKTPSGIRDSYCSSCKNQKTRLYTKNNISKYQRKVYNLKTMYGLELEDYNKILKNQNNKCLICNSYLLNIKYCVDHNHKTKEIRGILCSSCNQGLGQFKDNIENLLNAAKYLKEKGAYG